MFRSLKLLLVAFSIIMVSCSYNHEDDICKYNKLLPSLPESHDFLATGIIIIAKDNQKHKLKFVWEQNQQHNKIDIIGPLGMHIAEIDGEVLKIATEENSYNLRDFMLENLHYYISPLVLKAALLLHDSAIKVLEVTYGCSTSYNLPNAITLQPQNTDMILYIRGINWQL